MRSLATTRIVIENAKDIDEYGDPVDGSDTTLGGPYSASLIERRLTTVDPSDQTKVAFVRYAVLRVKNSVPVEQDNIISDLKGNTRWIVTSVTTVRTPMGPMDKVCQLRRLSS
jgi:hypothetical protein